MKILIINHYAGSREMGMEHRPYYLAKWWAEQGAEVLIAAAGYSHLRRVNPPKGVKGFCTIDGVKFYIIPTPSYRGNTLARAANIAEFMRGLYQSAHEIARRFAPDVVIASSTYPFDMLAAKKIRDLCGAKLIFEVHDIWPQSLIELYGFSRNNPLIRLLGAAERYAYQASDLVVSILPNLKHYIIDRRFGVKGYLHVPNGVEITGSSSGPQSHMDQIAALKRRVKLTIGYAGGFARANCTHKVAGLARELGEDFGVVMIGGSEQAQELKDSYSGCHNLLMLPPVPQQQLIGLLAMLDCLYLPVLDLPVYRYGIAMNKLFDYMLSGRPVILECDSPNNPIERSKSGQIIKPGGDQNVKTTIKKIADLGEINRCNLGLAGKAYVMNYHSYQRIAAFYLEQIRGRFGIE